MDVICGHRWTDDEIGDLLLRLSAAMADEVDVLAGLPPCDQVAAPTPRRRARPLIRRSNHHPNPRPPATTTENQR